MIYIITAGTKGLGRELSVQLAHKGHSVISLYHSDQSSAENFSASIKEQKLPIDIERLDILNQQAVALFCEKVIHGRTESIGLIHAASAHFELAPAQQWTEEQIEKLFEVNVTGFFTLAKALFPAMKKNKKSLLIGILSETIATDKPSKGFLGYNIAKIAMEGLLKSLAVEWEKAGIKTISFLPGSMDSGIFNRWPDHIQNMVAPGTPLSTEAVATKIIERIQDYEHIQSGGRHVISK